MNPQDAVVDARTEHEMSPFAMPSKKLLMWLFIASDIVTFAVLFYGYGYLRNSSSNWPTPFQFSPTILRVMGLTAILVTGGFFMTNAVHEANLNNRRSGARWMGLAALLGVLFIAIHMQEWRQLINEGLTLSHSPWGANQFGSAFFLLTGLHVLHVLAGVLALGIVAIGYRRGRCDAMDVEIWSLYWQFVEVVWIILVPMVYLLNAKV